MAIVAQSEQLVQNMLDMDANELAKAIKERKISSVEVTKAYINHVKQFNPSINCLVEDRFSEVIAEAIQADEQIEKGTGVGRLLGVPISMKESFDVAEMKTTGGLPYRKNNVQIEDAEVVARLKAEGAIILGKTNTPVLCFCQETDNKLYGRTNNPWDVNRTAGGSSGGEGAMIAAGGAAVGVGSDIGGSIRFPAHFNGVIGFKSGNRQVSDKGSFPATEIRLQQRMLGIGALAKSVQDAKLINEIIADQIPKAQQLTDFEITMPTRNLSFPINSDTHSLLLKVKKHLNKDYAVNGIQPPMFAETALLWQLMMSIDGARDIAELGFDTKSPQLFSEYLKERIFRSSKLHNYFTWALIGANLFKPSEQKVTQIERTITTGDEQISEFLEKRLLILPVYHSAAPVHGQVYSEIFSIRKTYLRYMPFIAYANVWGLPALVVPIGEDKNNMPIAVQVISKIGNEDAIFQLGEQIEQAFRGYKRKIFSFE